MMNACSAGVLGYVASLFSIFVLYPYRDFTKIFNLRSFPRVNFIEYSLLRYKGMILNPSQPLMLALPWGFLYGGFTLGSGSVTGALCAGTFHGISKVSVRTIARRFGGPRSRYDEVVYKSLIHCIQQSSKQYGILSFISGSLATILISTIWHGAALIALERSSYNGDFFGAWWDAFRVHAFLTFATNPIRNTFRSALYNTERAGGVHSLSSFLSGEVAVFREAAGVLRNMIRTEGVSFFLEGVMRTTFKSSLPFGFTFALFLTFGGSLPGQRSIGNEHRHRHHHHMPIRRFM